MLEINKDLVQTLIDAQFPQWANLSIYPVAKSGHDNRTFHLGDKMTVRLPSGKEYAPQVEKELLWLPKLQPYLSLPISFPIAKGEPTKSYPFSWTINKWIDGEPVTNENIADYNGFATDLAVFLKELQSIDATGGPMAGAHNFYRGGNLSVYHDETITALSNLKQVIPSKRLSELWTVALEANWSGKPVWVHGDIAVGNLLVKEGKLCGVIDFGILGVGDPACDYAIAWTFFDKESRRTFFNALACDENTRYRACGWALWKALITYNDKNIEVATNAKHAIAAILDDF